MLLQKRTDTRGVGISSMMKSIYLLTTTPSSHTHRFHPLPLATPASCSPHPLATPIHSTHSPQLSSILLTCASMDDNCGEWVECMGVVSRRRVWLVFLYFFVIKFNVLNNFFKQYKHAYRQLRASHGSHMKAAHNVLYIKKHTQTYVHILRWTSAV